MYRPWRCQLLVDSVFDNGNIIPVFGRVQTISTQRDMNVNSCSTRRASDMYRICVTCNMLGTRAAYQGRFNTFGGFLFPDFLMLCVIQFFTICSHAFFKKYL